MHPDQNRINQIVVKVTSKSQIPTFLTELTGIVQKDLKSAGAAKTPEATEYLHELQSCLNTSLNKVSDATLKTELKTQISNFIASQSKGAMGKGAGTHF